MDEKIEARLKALEATVQALSDEILELNDKIDTKADLHPPSLDD